LILKSIKKKFDAYYNEGLQKKNYAQATDALLAVFQLMSNRGYYNDDHYYIVLKEYLAKHASEIEKDPLFSFHIYKGVVETFSGKYEEAIKTLNQLDQFKPDNFSNYLDLGYAHYYISCNHYYLGDYIKSLETLNKSVAYFKHTDDLNGLIIVESWRAHVHFSTKNLQDAITTIDQAIKIYDKTNNPTGQVNLMLTKHDYLAEKYQDERHTYLDSIRIKIEKNNIQDHSVLMRYNHNLIRKNIVEKNVPSLDTLMPIFESQVKEANIAVYSNAYMVNEGEYNFLKNKKIKNKEALTQLLLAYKKNKDYPFSLSILKLFRKEAIQENNLAKVLAYDDEIKEIEETIAESELKFKVKVFEKKIDAEKKAKIIAQQKNELNQSRNFILSLAALVITIIFTFWIFSLRKKRKQALEEQLKQEQFTYQLLQNTEEERSRIAGELHDSVNQDLLTMKHNVLNGNQMVAEDFTNVIEEVRNISRNLHPSILKNLGLKASIEHLCEKLTDVGLFTTCEVEYENQVSKNNELQIYRIIQEALNNTLKHGKANAAKVILTFNEQFLHLEIKDNGNGFDVNKQLKNPQSFGLQSILQRAKAIGAKININSNAKGTVILMKIPF
jgi:signal transduction histidine kinase